MLEDGSHGDPRAASSEEPLTDRENLNTEFIEGRPDRAGVNAGHKEEKPKQTQGYMQECLCHGPTNQREFLRAMLPSMAPLGLMVRRCVAKSTATIPNLGSKPDIHSKLSSSDQVT